VIRVPDPTLHPDEAAFVRAVAAAPHDDAPRLVYADWLDDHGMPHRARFIRLARQVCPAIAATPVVPGRVLTDLIHEYPDVQAAAIAEVRTAVPRALWPFFDRTDGYRGGLLSEVHVAWNRVPGFVDAAPALFRAAPITGVSFELAWDNEDVFRRVPTTFLARFLELPEVGQLREVIVADVFEQMTMAARLLADCRYLSADAAVTVAATLPRAVRKALTDRFGPPVSKRGRG
jgi:uncharacterized protein (TIGR02996 family)